MKKISIVVAVYRNENAVIESYNRILTILGEELSNYSYEFIFVDDGSDDNSLSQLLEIRRSDPNVKVIQFSRNFGQMAAIVAGLRESSGDCCINISADLQDPPELLNKMISEWETNTEVVICYRIARDDSFAANMTSKIFYSIIRISVPEMVRGGFDYLLLDRKVVDSYLQFTDRNRFLQSDILSLGFTTKLIPYSRLKRTIGKSQWTVSKKLKSSIDGVLNTSYWPIRVMSLCGLFTSLAGFFYSVVILYGYFFARVPFKGWAPLMMITLIIGGMNMLMLGVVGEYLWRIYDEVRGRPMYIIKNRFI